MPNTYVTLSADLVEFADFAFDYLQGDGYRVKVEPHNLYYPNTPSLVGKRGATEHIVEVAAAVDRARIGDWVHYGRARGNETFVSVVVPEGVGVAVAELAALRAMGIGLCSAGPAGVHVVVGAIDLSTHIGLPDLARERAAVRNLLRDPFRKISDGAVIDGFKDAAAAFEKMARNHFLVGMRSTRISLVTNQGRPRQVTEAQISRMTLGQLGTAYSEIIAPTQADDLARRAIESILKDRNDATHNASESVKRRIKRNVPRHVFAILNALREIA